MNEFLSNRAGGVVEVAEGFGFGRTPRDADRFYPLFDPMHTERAFGRLFGDLHPVGGHFFFVGHLFSLEIVLSGIDRDHPVRTGFDAIPATRADPLIDQDDPVLAF